MRPDADAVERPVGAGDQLARHVSPPAAHALEPQPHLADLDLVAVAERQQAFDASGR